MALMTEERRKEMEEEMSRFELEIAAPGGTKLAVNASDGLIRNKPLSPPPPPPAVGVLIPEAPKIYYSSSLRVASLLHVGHVHSSVLAKVPPPPPPSSPPSLHAILRAPPPPPPPPPVIQSRPQQGTIRFIPHQLQRNPPRPPMRHNFIPVRGIPMGGPSGPYPPGPPIGSFMPPMAQAPGPQIQHMGHSPMHMPPGPMPMPPQMGMMPHGFCPPSGHGGMGHGPTMPCEPHTQQYMPASMMQTFEASVPEPNHSSSESPVVTAAPAVYAAPFVKSHADCTSEMLTTTNGQDSITATGMPTGPPKSEKQTYRHEEQQQSVGPVVPPVSANEDTVVSKKKEKKKKTVRMAGGQAWEDNSLLEWDPDDFRIFCGDLGNDVTDEVLIRAFSKYPSFVKAKVIRDKRTNKTKGYGFVSFKDPQDFIKAMREMNGKYVGSRPIKLRKSTWKDRNIDIVKKKQREKEKLGLL